MIKQLLSINDYYKINFNFIFKFQLLFEHKIKLEMMIFYVFPICILYCSICSY